MEALLVEISEVLDFRGVANVTNVAEAVVFDYKSIASTKI